MAIILTSLLPPKGRSEGKGKEEKNCALLVPKLTK
jgi:hypothetical protein